MSAHKGISTKQALTTEDLAELVDIYRRLQHMHGTLNYRSHQQLPLLAASATVKAAWAEISGAGWAWSYPATAVPLNGIPAGSQAQERRESRPMRPIGPLPDEPGSAGVNPAQARDLRPSPSYRRVARDQKVTISKP